MPLHGHPHARITPTRRAVEMVRAMMLANDGAHDSEGMLHLAARQAGPGNGWCGCGGLRPVATLTAMDASNRGHTTDLARSSSSLDLELDQSLRVLESQGLLRSLRRVDKRTGAVIQSNRGKLLCVDFWASNDYLGLAGDARIASAAADALRTNGTGPLRRDRSPVTMPSTRSSSSVSRHSRAPRRLSFSPAATRPISGRFRRSSAREMSSTPTS